MSIKYIGITGKDGVGKSTVASIIQSQMQLQFSHQYVVRHFAEKLKQIGVAFFGEELNKNDLIPEWARITNVLTYRDWLRYVGTELFRQQYNEDIWVEAAFASPTPYSVKGVVFDDVRFPNEVDEIQKRKGLIVKVVRPGVNGGDHSSETSLDNYTPDFIMVNDGTLLDLHKTVKLLINNLIHNVE